MEREFDAVLRNKLALERTYLAKERTILAYIRTGITMVGMALFIYKFIKLELIYEVLVILLLMVPGVGVIAYGIYKTVVHRKERKKIESECERTTQTILRVPK